VTWPRTHKLLLVLGICLWALAATLTPGELTAAKRRDKIGARTAMTLIAYLAAAVCVLRGLPTHAPQPGASATGSPQNAQPRAAAPPPGSGTAPNDTRGAGA